MEKYYYTVCLGVLHEENQGTRMDVFGMVNIVWAADRLRRVGVDDEHWKQADLFRTCRRTCRGTRHVSVILGATSKTTATATATATSCGMRHAAVADRSCRVHVHVLVACI